MVPLVMVNVGLVGTGYAAKLRADTVQADPRSQLIAVAGHLADKTESFSEAYGAQPLTDWEDLVARSDIDLVFVSTINRDHAKVTWAALTAGKHVVVEYPLALDFEEAEALTQLAAQQNRLLHVEHIELLSGIHLAIQSALPAIGKPFYFRYASLAPQRPAPPKWTYQPDLFGFPLVGALSRVHRLTHLFGTVKTVNGQARFWGGTGSSSFYTSCVCSAQLQFESGLMGEVVYGKGEAIWRADRTLTIQGEQGAVVIDGEQGTLIQGEQTIALDMGTRRGLFAKDTTQVLDYLINSTPLYVTLESSLHALWVADAARRSSETGQIIKRANIEFG